MFKRKFLRPAHAYFRWSLSSHSSSVSESVPVKNVCFSSNHSNSNRNENCQLNGRRGVQLWPRHFETFLHRSSCHERVNYIHTTKYRYSLSAQEVKKAIENLTDQFSEARELMEDARESMGTVYFSDDMEDAQVAVTETLDEYKQLLEKLSDTQKAEVLRTIGLKMEELKAQLQAIHETLQE